MNYAKVGAKQYPPKERAGHHDKFAADDMVCIFL